MGITATDIKLQVKHINTYVLEDSNYIIRYERHSGHNWLYLHKRDEAERRLRCLFGGTTKEVNAYLTTLQHNHWYMNETV